LADFSGQEVTFAKFYYGWMLKKGHFAPLVVDVI